MSDEEGTICGGIGKAFSYAWDLLQWWWPVQMVLIPFAFCVVLAAVISAVFGVLMLFGLVR
jgi:hypothetical protein